MLYLMKGLVINDGWIISNKEKIIFYILVVTEENPSRDESFRRASPLESIARIMYSIKYISLLISMAI